MSCGKCLMGNTSREISDGKCASVNITKLLCACCHCQSARKPRGKTSAKKVKSKEIVDEVASDESNKEKDDSALSGGGKRKQRHGVKNKPSVTDKDGKPHRKRQTKNKVCQNVLCLSLVDGQMMRMNMQFGSCCSCCMCECT